jgi:hypothetical protein
MLSAPAHCVNSFTTKLRFAGTGERAGLWLTVDLDSPLCYECAPGSAGVPPSFVLRNRNGCGRDTCLPAGKPDDEQTETCQPILRPLADPDADAGGLC